MPEGDPGPDSRLAAAARLVRRGAPRLGGTRLVAVDGPSGSGKTSLAGPLAAALAAECGGAVIRPRCVSGGGGATRYDVSPSPAGPLPSVAVVSTDLLATWDDPFDWWPVWEECLLAPIAAGRVARMPVVQWVSGAPRPGGEIVVPPVDVLVTEGVSSGRAAVADRLTALVWVEHPDPAVRLERAVARDGEATRAHLLRWQRREREHFAADGTRDRADIVIAV